ncbi:pentapeptide repeat-containing protein [Streptomyces sp. Root369]|uniref:pentapeptide repeat-containing protein n=1 Tax=Streptomyces sp. Root369 TaxID=1736523 RepID=UPI00322176F0
MPRQPSLAPTPPSWPYCGDDPSPERPFGCPGIHVPGHTACLAHLDSSDRDAYLAGLDPGSGIDHRGTSFTEPLLDALLAVLRDPATGNPRIGDARFESATFEGDAWFESATFGGDAWFESATFGGDAWFGSATFKGDAEFGSATFKGDAEFVSATFERASTLGPLVCVGRVKLSGAVFSRPVTLSFAAFHVECRRTRWSSTAEVRLRYATVDFAHAVFEYPLTIAAGQEPFVLAGGQLVTEAPLAGLPDAAVRLASLRGVDAGPSDPRRHRPLRLFAHRDRAPGPDTPGGHLFLRNCPARHTLAGRGTGAVHPASHACRRAPLARSAAGSGPRLALGDARRRACGACATGAGVPGTAQGV